MGASGHAWAVGCHLLPDSPLMETTSDASCGILCMLFPSVSPGNVCRLFKKSYLGVIHYSLLLMLFGAAAFKAVHTPLLTAMLVSELASVLCLAGKMQASINPALPDAYAHSS